MIQQNVQWLANAYPEVKDNYNVLIAKYWQHFEGITSLEHVLVGTSSESITRAFRSLVRNGQIELSTKTKAQRREERRAYIQDYHKHALLSLPMNTTIPSTNNEVTT